jgi:hypothetical protein
VCHVRFVLFIILTFYRLYYCHLPSRVNLCRTTVHALLHVVSGIRYLGPPWVYWEWFMERYCKRLGDIILSARNPWPSIDEYILVTTQASVVSLRYSLTREQLGFLPLAGHAPNEFTEKIHCV